jgi:predicted small lipoprotein YifL
MRLLRVPHIGHLLDVGRSRDGARKSDRLLGGAGIIGRMTVLRVLLLLALAAAAACGQKGPLVLPDAQHPRKKLKLPAVPKPQSMTPTAPETPAPPSAPAVAPDAPAGPAPNPAPPEAAPETTSTPNPGPQA